MQLEGAVFGWKFGLKVTETVCRLFKVFYKRKKFLQWMQNSDIKNFKQFNRVLFLFCNALKSK